MKASYILIIISLLVVALAAWGMYEMHIEAHEIIGICNEMLLCIEKNDKEEAGKILVLTIQRWQNAERFWRMTVSHREMQSVSSLLAAVKSEILYDNLDEAHRDINMLIDALWSIDAELFPHMGNIF